MRIGVDIGGMSAKIGLCEGKNVLRSVGIPTGEDIEFSFLLDRICAEIQKLTAGIAYDFVGVSSCGLIDTSRGSVVFSNNIRWREKPLAEELSRRTGKDVKIANDAKCAALAEAVYGAGKAYERVCMLTLGTGVGGAFICRKKLACGSPYADADGILGHIAVEKNGRLCSCGRRGCLEAYASATALMRRYKELTGVEETAKEIFEKARNRESAAIETVHEFVEYLAEGLADLVNVLRPEIVVLGGGVSGAADMFLEPLSRLVNERIFAGKYLPVEFAKAELGNEAGMIGATLLREA